MKKRMLSWILALTLVCTSMPCAFSEETEEVVETVSAEQVITVDEEQTEKTEEVSVTETESAETEEVSGAAEVVTDTDEIVSETPAEDLPETETPEEDEGAIPADTTADVQETEDTVQETEDTAQETEDTVQETEDTAQETEDTAQETEESDPEVEAATEEVEEAPAVYAVNVLSVRHLTVDAPATVTAGNSVAMVLTAEEGYKLPASVSLTIGGNGVAVKSLTRAEAEELREKNELAEDAVIYYTDAGKVAIPAVRVNGDIVLNAEGVKIEEETPVTEQETITEEPVQEITEEPVQEITEEEVVPAALEIVITAQPQDIVTKTGAKVSFTVAAENVASYQWMYSSNGGTSWRNTSFTGATTNTLSMTARSTYYPYLWKCVLTDANGGTLETNVVQIKEPVVAPEVVITAQPQDVTAKTGVSISFTVEADNAVSYQWMYSSNGGTSWRNTSFNGATTKTLSMTARSTYYPYLWKCVLKNADGVAVETNVVQIKEPVVAPEVVITAQPEDQYTKTGVSISFTVEAENAVSYQWMYSTNNGTSWRNTSFTGATTNTLSMTARSTYYPYLWKCVLKNADGVAVETNVVQIKEPVAAPAVVITAQPKDQYSLTGVKVSFTVEAENVVSYQWKYSNNNGDTWRNTSFDGATTATLSMTARSTYYPYLWKCALTDGDGNVTETDIVQIKAPQPAKTVAIVAQPEDQYTETGKKISFTVEAENAASYQWMYSTNNGDTWRNTSFEGATTAKLSMTARSTYYSYLWKCVLKNADGAAVETNVVQIKLPVPDGKIVINTMPVSKSAEVGKRTSFVVDADNVVSYQWMVSKDNGETWTESTLDGNTTNTLNLIVQADHYSWSWKCVMTGENGDTAETDVVGVKAPVPSEIIVITAQPENQIGQIGTKVYLTVTAENAVGYQWMYSRDDGKTWRTTTLSGCKTATLTLTVKQDYYAWPWKCVLTDEAGDYAETEPAWVIDPASVQGKIVTEPTNTVAAADETATFSVEAENIATYQWQYSEDAGKTWVDCTDTGYDTATLSVAPSTERVERNYRCSMIGLDGETLITQMAHIIPPIVIHVQPEPVIANEGDEVTFSIDSEYWTEVKWQYSADNGETWNDCDGESAASETLTLTVTGDMFGYLFRCMLTGGNPDVVVSSDVVSLTIEVSYVNNIAYTLTEEEYYVVSGNKDLSGAVVVESEINGLPVIAVGDEAFKGNTAITSVTLPSSVTSIGVSAFEGCTNLASVTLSNNVCVICSRAFANCSSLKSMNCTD